MEPRLHWEEHPGDGPPMLFVHGFLSSRSQWRENLAPLAKICRPVVVELWGHGRSPAGASPDDYSSAGYLRQFEAIRERLAVERWYLCGQSLGASLTLRYSLAFPERVIAQVITNSNSAFATAEIIVERRRLATAAIADLEARGLAAVEDLPVHPRRARRLPADLHREMVADTRRIDPRAIADSYRHLNVDVSVRDAARLISVPTLMVCGSYEKRFAPHRDYAAAAVPGLRTVDLPAGHAVNAERSDEFNAAVKAFLADVAGDAEVSQPPRPPRRGRHRAEVSPEATEGRSMTTAGRTIEVRAAVCREFGAPLALETLHLSPPEGREVRVRVLASSICHSDIIYLDGGWGGSLPAVFGHEVAGVVTDAGPAVPANQIRPGDRVLVSLLRSCGRCESCETGIPSQCTAEFSIDTAPRLRDGRGRPVRAGLRVGGFAEGVVVDASQAVKLPADIADEAAALISCGVLTGFGAAINTARVQVGDAVAVVGCGGVGLNCVQGAALAGAFPLLAIDVSEDKLERARTFGATHTLDAGDADLGERARALTDGRGFDVVMPATGQAKVIEDAFDLLAPNGSLVSVGLPPDGERVALDATELSDRNRRILGCKLGGARLRVDVPRLLRLYRSGRLMLDELISSRRPLTEINDSIDLARRSRDLRHVIVFPG